jgi:hypothetical protein
MKEKINIIRFMFVVLLALSLVSLYKCDESTTTDLISNSIEKITSTDFALSDSVSDSLEDITHDVQSFHTNYFIQLRL